jgi:hypothetical protein
MKILILSEGRTGSHSLGDWLSKELLIPFIFEDLKFNYEKNESFIHKIYYNPKIELVDFNIFDKIIVLYRENTFEQAISSVYSIKTGKYRHSKDKLDGYYNITKEFCVENYSYISDLIETLNDNNSRLKGLNSGLKMSYEEIFIDKVGQQKIEDYIGFKAKINIVNPKFKLREINEEMDLYLKNLIKKNKKKLI